MNTSPSGRPLGRVGVVGSGHIGPDIALFFARALAGRSVPVILHDISAQALERGRASIDRKLRKAVETGTFAPPEAEAIARQVTATTDPGALAGCDLVVEAIPDRLELKRALFAQLEKIVAPDAILASNTSHLTPEELFSELRRPERALVYHFFYPAERNPLVEVASTEAGAEAARRSCRFLESLGKVPLRVRGRTGFAVNPVFEGLFLACLLLSEREGIAPPVIDAIACRVLGLGAGPFAVMNLTGGTTITREGLRLYHEKISPWFRVPPLLEEHAAAGRPWPQADKGETFSYSARVFELVERELHGALFALTLEVLESGVADLGDLELGVELGLAMKAPFALMNELGPERVRERVEAFLRNAPGFPRPGRFGPWEIPYVQREDQDGVAVLTLRRPRVLNALNRDVFRQLRRHFEALRNDPRIRGAVLTGFGPKAFAAGADVAMLEAIRSPEEARALSWESNETLLRLEQLGKPVVCAMNGLSLGGGSELAYACTARIARRGVSPLFGQPEIKLGIIPGAGGTQRLPRLIDFATAWKLLRTGGSISATEALRLGLVREEVEADVLLERAVELARSLPPAAPLGPVRPPTTLPEVSLEGLSRKVDEILRRAILEGAPLPLEEALRRESELFGEVFRTRDCRIGLENFRRTGLKQPAPFVHA
ncbi:MAG: 3-hydroxyacyl-CoA dehydrogenase/enoyl-CoA hydratase family protein [Planctomycetota bacterium]